VDSKTLLYQNPPVFYRVCRWILRVDMYVVAAVLLAVCCSGKTALC